MTFDRVGSIFFYMLIAWTTCLMAYKVQPYQPSEPKWVNGQRTKKHFENRLYRNFFDSFCGVGSAF